MSIVNVEKIMIKIILVSEKELSIINCEYQKKHKWLEN